MRNHVSILCLCVLCASAVNLLSAAPAAQPQQRQAQLSWWDRAGEGQAGRYWIKTDLSADAIRPIAQRLNVMYEQYSQRMAHLPVRVQENLTVYVFAKRKDYEFTLRARYGLNAAGTGGMFFTTPIGAGLAFFTDELPMQRVWHVMQHEGFHQFAHSRFAEDLPVWVNEGMAEFFGEAVVVNDTLVIGQSNPRVLDALKKAIANDQTISFDRMLEMRSREWAAALKNGSAAMQYQQAWSMIHFLVYGDSGKYTQSLETYLRNLNNGLPAREAFTRSFGDDIPAFERRWKMHVLDAKPSAFVGAMEKVEFLAEGLIELGRQKQYPDTLDALKSALGGISFTKTIRSHGLEIKLSADDDAMFEIPRDDLNAKDEQPAFVLSKPKPDRMTVKERKLEDANPTPANLGTERLRPRNLQVKWIRDEAENVWHYEIVVK